jgi:SAM-dependent methyltransferase
VQIGCNNGRETLSALALGATHATGIDQSDAFIAQAEELRAVSPHGARADFVCADVYALPEGLEGRFDLALITIGLINWMPDLPQFLKIAASLLVPGGRLVIYETHPVLDMFEPYGADPHRLRYSYFRTEPFITDEEIVYDGSANRQGAAVLLAFPHHGRDHYRLRRGGSVIRQLTEYPHSNREARLRHLCRQRGAIAAVLHAHCGLRR